MLGTVLRKTNKQTKTTEKDKQANKLPPEVPCSIKCYYLCISLYSWGKKHEVTKNHAETQRENISIKVFSYKKFKTVENALNHAKKNSLHLKKNIRLFCVYTIGHRIGIELLNLVLIILSRYSIPFLHYTLLSCYQIRSVTQLCPILRPHESQHARPPYPSPTPGVHSNSCLSSR